MFLTASARKVAARYALLKNAGPLQDVSKLRYQAVFMIGAGGSGKGYRSHRWLKYLPGGGASGADRPEWEEKVKEKMTDQMRGLSNLNFEKARQDLKKQNIRIELVDGGASIPFRLYNYDQKGRERLIDPEDWATELPPRVYNQVEGLKEVIFNTPVHELPSYWRQVNPDIYKEELSGYLETQPGYVHEMSSEMAKAYFEAALETGDPLFIDGTGSNLGKMKLQIEAAKAAGYRTSLVFVYVPLTVNQIRNATRSRNVNPLEVIRQWKVISGNYVNLRKVADKATVIDARDDAFDQKTYAKHADHIENFIRKGTGGQYGSLYELIADNAPAELSVWGSKLRR